MQIQSHPRSCDTYQDTYTPKIFKSIEIKLSCRPGTKQSWASHRDNKIYIKNTSVGSRQIPRTYLRTLNIPNLKCRTENQFQECPNVQVIWSAIMNIFKCADIQSLPRFLPKWYIYTNNSWNLMKRIRVIIQTPTWLTDGQMNTQGESTIPAKLVSGYGKQMHGICTCKLIYESFFVFIIKNRSCQPTADGLVLKNYFMGHIGNLQGCVWMYS